MASFRIYSTLFIIAALAICSTASLSPMLFTLHQFIGAEDHTATAKNSTLQPATTESPQHQDNKNFQDMSDLGKGFLIFLVSVLSLAFAFTFVCALDVYIGSRKDWGRKFYFAFRDNVCCGFCVRRMGKGKLYEYEEI